MNNKSVYVVIELHSDVPKIRGIFENKKDAENVAYDKNNKYWRNVVKIELNKVL